VAKAQGAPAAGQPEDAPTGASAVTAAAAGDYVTVSVTIPAERLAEFYQHAAHWLSGEPDVPPNAGRGWTRTS